MGSRGDSQGKMTRWGTLGLGHIERGIVKHARKGERDFGEGLSGAPEQVPATVPGGWERWQTKAAVAAAAAAAGQPGFSQLQTGWLQAHLPVPWA